MNAPKLDRPKLDRLIAEFDRDAGAPSPAGIFTAMMGLNLSSTHTKSIAPTSSLYLKRLRELTSAEAELESLVIEVETLQEQNQFIEATLLADEAAKKAPAQLRIALLLRDSHRALLGAFMDLVHRNPTAPELGRFFDVLHERGSLSTDAYFLAARHFVLTSQPKRAKAILEPLQRLMPGFQFVRELIAEIDGTLSHFNPAAPRTLDRDETSQPSLASVAATVEALDAIKEQMDENNYSEILRMTDRIAASGVIDCLTESVLYYRALALDYSDRKFEAIEIFEKLRAALPLVHDYHRGLFISMRRLERDLVIVLQDEPSDIARIDKIFVFMNKHGGMSQNAGLTLYPWLVKMRRFEHAHRLMSSLMDLMPNDADNLKTVLSRSLRGSADPLLKGLEERALTQLRKCRIRRPFDFQYWQEDLADVA